MRRLAAVLALASVAGLAVPSAAQNVVRAGGPQSAPAQDIATLSDEFNGSALTGWTRFDQAFGWPDKFKTLDVGGVEPGLLRIEPHHSAWVRDLNAPFIFRDVVGDFDVRARVRAHGLNGDIPGGNWSLGGLMARVPNASTAASWSPRSENWHFITTGVGNNAGEQMIETKGTYNSYSSLKLRPAPTGWIELRLVRVGMALFALARPEGETRWQVRDRFYRMENSPRMQVGLIAYTHSVDVPQGPDNAEVANRTVNREAQVDMALDVDWIRFARPRPQVSRDWYHQVSANPLADPNLPEAAVLEALGD
ncbi:hypothetical protein [Brevundimonas sp. Root1423]|uniref:hypothetical protein n=1 Tax=Brevundimonas sp. Root1423 TaxID=1736462 RepID=UPI000700B7B9|nr:hypothetical protein [Brevundimonas sp. Root1423]KQY84703.1 hypothetical protein ASD25_06640 [Brevundimonas sp. Root1423]